MCVIKKKKVSDRQNLKTELKRKKGEKTLKKIQK